MKAYAKVTENKYPYVKRVLTSFGYLKLPEIKEDAYLTIDENGDLVFSKETPQRGLEVESIYKLLVHLAKIVKREINIINNIILLPGMSLNVTNKTTNKGDIFLVFPLDDGLIGLVSKINGGVIGPANLVNNYRINKIHDLTHNLAEGGRVLWKEEPQEKEKVKITKSMLAKLLNISEDRIEFAEHS